MFDPERNRDEAPRRTFSVPKLIPEFYPSDPFHHPGETDPREQVIYISKFAREMLDGPLIHKAYILPMVFDKNKETTGAIRAGRYRAMYFPIRKYIKWQTGSVYLPFQSSIRVLNEVASNGGNWEIALKANIAKRHLRTTEERKQAMGLSRYEKVIEDRKKLVELSETVLETLGEPQPLPRLSLDAWEEEIVGANYIRGGPTAAATEKLSLYTSAM